MIRIWTSLYDQQHRSRVRTNLPQPCHALTSIGPAFFLVAAAAGFAAAAGLEGTLALSLSLALLAAAAAAVPAAASVLDVLDFFEAADLLAAAAAAAYLRWKEEGGIEWKGLVRGAFGRADLACCLRGSKVCGVRQVVQVAATAGLRSVRDAKEYLYDS